MGSLTCDIQHSILTKTNLNSKFNQQQQQQELWSIISDKLGYKQNSNDKWRVIRAPVKVPKITYIKFLSTLRAVLNWENVSQSPSAREELSYRKDSVEIWFGVTINSFLPTNCGFCGEFEEWFGISITIKKG